MPYGGYSGSSGESNSGSGYDNAGGVYSTSGVTSNLSYPSRPGIRSSLVSASDMSGIVMVSSTEPSISGASGLSSSALEAKRQIAINERLKKKEAVLYHLLNAALNADTFYDHRIGWRCWVMLILASVGMVCMVISLEVGFKGVGVPLEENFATEVPKIVTSATTLPLLIVLVDYYRVKNQIYNSVQHFEHFVPMWRNKSLLFRLAIELLINLYHPLPWVHGFDTEAGIFMFLRLYHIIRVIRNRSRIFRERGFMRLFAAAQLGGRGKNSIPLSRGEDLLLRDQDYGAGFSIKVFFAEQSVTFFLGLFLGSLAVLSYIIYVAEREQNEDLATWTVLYFVIITLTTVGYGDQLPVTAWGRFTVSIAAVWGLVLGSLMVAVILDFLLLRPHQKFAAEWSRVSKIFDAERETAARFILFSFKMNRKKASGERMTASEEQQMHKLISLLRHFRKERQMAENQISDPTAVQLQKLMETSKRNEILVSELERTYETQVAGMQERIDRITGLVARLAAKRGLPSASPASESLSEQENRSKKASKDKEGARLRRGQPGSGGRLGKRKIVVSDRGSKATSGKGKAKGKAKGGSKKKASNKKKKKK